MDPVPPGEPSVNSASPLPQHFHLLLSCQSENNNNSKGSVKVYLVLVPSALLLYWVSPLFALVLACAFVVESGRVQHLNNQDNHQDENMAILESEKRPKGLRVPSLSSIKAFTKKSSDSSQQQQQEQQQQQKMDALPEAFTTGRQEKQLPPQPSQATAASAPMAAPMPMRIPAASATPFNLDAPMADLPGDRYPMPPGPSSGSAPTPSRPRGESNSTINGNTYNRAPGSLAIPPVQRTPSNGSHRSDDPDIDPLEDYIPDPYTEGAQPPEMMLDSAGEGNELDNDNQDPGAWTPPDYEPVAAPLNKLHFACYQEHRSMPVAANVWHAVPCMTCQKFDRENRRRCVFCCLRICEGCYQNLLKCQRRSLNEMLEMIQA